MKMQRLAKMFLGATLAVSMLAGCTGDNGGAASTDGGNAGSSTTTATSTTSDSGNTDTAPAPANGTKVGVSMPTKDLQRWNQDGANMESQLKQAGYEVEPPSLLRDGTVTASTWKSSSRQQAMRQSLPSLTTSRTAR